MITSLPAALLLTLLAALPVSGQTKISDLPAASASTAGVYPIVQSGSTNKGTITANGYDLIAAANYAAMRGLLDLEAGTDFYSKSAADAAFQPLDTDLTALAGIAGVQGDVLYRNGSTWVALGAGSSGQFLKTNGAGANPAWATIAGGGDLLSTNNLSDVASAGTARTNLGLAIGTNVQAFDADLTTLAGLTATTDNFLQAKSSAWASRTPTQVTADLIPCVGDAGAGGSKGLVPAPVTGDATKFLRGDCTFVSIPGGGDALTANPLSQFAATTSLQLLGVISNETGSGALVFGTAPQLSSVELGHASDTSLTRVSAGVAAIEGSNILTAATGQPLDSDLTSWAAVTRASGYDTFAATASSANLRALLSDESGTGAALFAGGDLGTPSAGVATNLTGTASGLTSGITNALKSATTTVDVSAAAAPSSGQVLTATDSTHATWQTPGGSSSVTWTLVGTLTTTSGSNQTQALGATCNEVILQLDGVSSGANSGNLRVQVSDDGTTYDTAQQIGFAIGTSTDTTKGQVRLLNTGLAATTKYVVPQNSLYSSANALVGPYVTVGTQASENGVTSHVRMNFSTGSFDAGTASIYCLN